MFVHRCTSCERRELIFADQLHGLEAHEDGFRVHLTCWCGAQQTAVVTRDVAVV
ncbi:hypothetical protein KG112_05095 [Nocardioides sp. zg-ZUI104]|uniref:hypothetical protein n=1 Tax=Nocardioides faecalis TaxID=2803858 RepID=UPI001BD15BFE|nr:hypothetical protein [Nocardioides faecalis]MBS4752182.1 hypothetical protein [Nocardioides faecalis]